jgi:crotonobetainyl-CoA:carnitine CoA-transferase CaiB-like acyl-CoA transferase
MSGGAAPGQASLPLDGVRVLECGDALAVAYAGRLLDDLGADVVKMEPPEGDPLRAAGPFSGGIPDRDMSGSFAYFNAGKRSVLFGAGPARPPELARRADVVVRGTRRGVDWISDGDLQAAGAAYPGLIVADISTYGRSEPGPLYPNYDLLALAAGGLLGLNASEPMDPQASPLRYKGELSSIHAGANAVLAVLGALFERDRSGRGQWIDVSAQAAVATILATALSRYTYTGTRPGRDGTRSVSPWGFYQCRDGMVLIQCTEDAEFRRLLDLFGHPEWGDLEIFATTAQRETVIDALDLFVGQEMARFSQEEFLDLAFQHRVAAAPINYGADIMGWDHLAERGFLEPVKVEGRYGSGQMRLPGRPWRYRGEELPGRGPSPKLGECGGDADAIWPARPAPAPAEPTSAAAGHRPLEGVRVIDLTWVWAGPHAAMQLAHLGADVIRIETSTRIDVTRRLGPFVDDRYGIDRSGYFNQYNQGKRSICIDLKTPAGLALLEQLIARSDVVIDNMSAGALDRMGLPYERLRALNPKIVAVSMTGFGETGPYRDHPAYGSLIDALAGTSSSNGLVGGGPTDLVMSLPDPTAGLHAAVATLGALRRAHRGGGGARVECAMLEAFLASFPWPVIFAGVAGHDAPVMGNRDELHCPHGVFPCRGEDRWIAVAVDTDERFEAMAKVMGMPELATDPRFATLGMRRVHESVLEDLIAGWSSGQDPDRAVAILREAGVPAEKVLWVDEVLASNALMRRQFFTRLPHPEFGVRPLAGVPWRCSRSDMGVGAAAPALGQHTAEVLAGVLGLGDADIAVLASEGVTL